jgi:hypothetical protein
MSERIVCPECGTMRTWRQMPEHLERGHSCTPHQVGRIMAKLEKQAAKQNS